MPKKKSTASDLAMKIIAKEKSSGITALELNKKQGRKGRIGIGPMKTVLNRLEFLGIVSQNGVQRDEFPVFQLANGITKDNMAEKLLQAREKIKTAPKAKAKKKSKKSPKTVKKSNTNNAPVLLTTTSKNVSPVAPEIKLPDLLDIPQIPSGHISLALGKFFVSLGELIQENVAATSPSGK